MILKDILVISGQSGLFKYISRGRNNVIVENLFDNKRSTIPATARISMLQEIVVFTETNNVTLREIYKKIQVKENGGTAISHKSPDAELRKYFEEVLPEYDKNRVYLSDIRKILQWYNLLHELGISDFEDPEETKEEKPEETKEELPEEKEVAEKTTENN